MFGEILPREMMEPTEYLFTLEIEIEGESVDELIHRLGEIQNALSDGFTSGEGWDLKEE